MAAVAGREAADEVSKNDGVFFSAPWPTSLQHALHGYGMSWSQSVFGGDGEGGGWRNVLIAVGTVSPSMLSSSAPQ